MAKNNSEMKSLRKKLVAAIAMVMVASIMVVSSSYAWFTLSTAPEVKGIQTSVGSNGNLEMALITDGLEIETATSLQDYPTSNNYWGNLVDLSDAGYNLSAISLAPARLNVNPPVLSGTLTATTERSAAVEGETHSVGGKVIIDGTEYPISAIEWTNDTEGTYPATISYQQNTYTYTIDKAGPLKTAEYGTDGRISAIRANTYTGKNVDGTFKAGGEGVRVVGTSSGLTPEQIALRDAVDVVTSARNTARALAVQSLTVDSVKLANILIDNKLNNTATVTAGQLAEVQAAIANLQSLVAKLKTAADATVTAVGVYQQIEVTAVAYNPDNETIAITTQSGTVSFAGLETLETELLASYKKIHALETKLQTAASALQTEEDGGEPYEFTAVSTAMSAILKTEDMLLDGNALNGDPNAMKTLVFNAYVKYSGTLPFTITSGLYNDIAEFVENYDAKTEMTVTNSMLEELAGSATMTVKVTMATTAKAPAANKTAFYLPYFVTAISSLQITGDGSGSGNGDIIISDYYGYAIDLAFRTNAVGSSLLLQTAGISRVGDNAAEAVQGQGSYMEFHLSENAATNGYTMNQMVELLKGIRVVLTDFNSGEILGVAVLNVALEPVMVESVRKEADANSVFTETVGEVTYEMQLSAGTLTADKTGIKAALYLCNYSFDSEGKITIGDLITSQNQAVITALQQNVATGVSALVYLDGDVIDNADVAINGDSVSGTMNLQFSSSAQLEPMDYTFGETTQGTLAAPTISLNGNTLTVNAVDNATGYDIYVGDVKVHTLNAAGTYTLPTAAEENFPEGTLSITVKATAPGYTTSNASAAVTYTIPANP